MPSASIRYWRSGARAPGNVTSAIARPTIPRPSWSRRPPSPTCGRCDRGCWARGCRGSSSSLALACSDETTGAGETLAPILTTTTTSTTLPPTTTQPRFYKIQPGDTLIEIAAAFGLPIPAIMEANGIVDPNESRPGRSSSCPRLGDRRPRRCRR